MAAKKVSPLLASDGLKPETQTLKTPKLSTLSLENDQTLSPLIPAIKPDPAPSNISPR